jgi:DNA polymerase III subunit chi
VTQIDFYTGTTDRLLITCRLCAKAVQQGLRILILVPDASLAEQLDKLLWTFSPVSFVPHCQANDKLADLTPVILSGGYAQTEGNSLDVLFNLDDKVPKSFEYFSRVVEIVDEAASNKQLARERYRFYQEQGCSVRHHRLELG